MDSLRRPFFFVAIALIALAVLTELTGPSVLGNIGADFDTMDQALKEAIDKKSDDELGGADRILLFQKLKEQSKADKPPGLAVRFQALLDGLVLFTVVLIAAPMLIREGIHGRVQGIITLVVSIVVLLLALLLFFVALQLLLLMVALLTAAPFGTLAYLALFGFFNRGGASVTLGLVMALKLGFVGCLVLAHQRFLQNKGLVLIVLTSLLGTVIISFLHGLVPQFLVSITDAIAAIIVVILAALWAIFMLIGSIIAIVKAIVSQAAALPRT